MKHQLLEKHGWECLWEGHHKPALWGSEFRLNS